jgi:probable rRNA maturation factor
VFRDPRRLVRRAELRDFLEEIARRILRGRSVVCLLTGDDDLRRLNRQFRGLNYATDVLSFPPDTASTAGEIAISLDRASAQAAEHGHSLADEIRILMLHGVLHLAGMDHESDSGEMAEAEIRWRRRLGLPTGLIERANQPRPGAGASRGTRA